MKTLHFASPPRALWGLLAALLLLSIASPAAAAPTFAVRTDLGISSLEGELFLGRFGLLALVQTGYESSLCTGTFSRALYGARWFFKRPQSSWYLGILSTRPPPPPPTCAPSAPRWTARTGLAATTGCSRAISRST